jgi:glycosyltransferase involved in cell wall biosynthesis
VLRLCQSLGAAGVEVDVVTTDADGPGDLDVPVDRWTTVQGVRVRYFHRHPRVDYALSPGLARFVQDATRRYDLVHLTSTFSFPTLAAGYAACARGTPYVVSPRGSLRTVALSAKRWKKAPYWWIFERRNLARASAIHATSQVEAADVCGVLPGADVFVIPNACEDIRPPPVVRSTNRIVFLGRIHPIKGFDVLVPALRVVALQRPDVETLIAGPDNDGEWRRVARLIEAQSPRPRVRWVGPVDGAGKYEFLASARVLVLPSHSENFGQAVLEGLACGTPAVVSRNCPWRSLEEGHAGCWVENTPEAVAAALLRILDDDALFARMSVAAARLASRYTMAQVGTAMAATYARIMSRQDARSRSTLA